MFEPVKVCIELTKTTFRVGIVRLKKIPALESVGSAPWTPETLQSLLATVRKKFHQPVRCIVHDELIYSVLLTFPTSEIVTRQIVEQRTQEYIPDDLATTLWDFRTIVSGESSAVYVAALVASVSLALKEAAEKSKLTIEAIEPTSGALARLTRHIPGSLLLIDMTDNHTTFTVTQNGIVHKTAVETQPINQDSLNEWTNTVKTLTGTTVTKILMRKSGTLPPTAVVPPPNIPMMPVTLEPFLGAAQKNDIKGPDGAVLNLYRLFTTPIHPKPDGATVPPALATLLIFLIPSLAIGATFWLLQRSTSKPVRQPVIPTSTVSTTPSPTIMPSPTVMLSRYAIRIENGSEKEGEAARLKTVLEQKGFTVKETKNASTTSGTTVVRAKPVVPPSWIQALDTLLQSSYTVTQGPLEDTKNNEGIDVVITIGKT